MVGALARTNPTSAAATTPATINGTTSARSRGRRTRVAVMATGILRDELRQERFVLSEAVLVLVIESGDRRPKRPSTTID